MDQVMARRVVGVDPGYHGGVSFLGGRKITTYPMPVIKVGRRTAYDLEAITGLIRAINPDLLVVEQVTRPGRLVGCQWFFMGLAYGLNIPLKTVRPQVWRPFVGLKNGEGKDKSILKAIELFPELSETITRKSQDGEAEAALIAWWGSKQ